MATSGVTTAPRKDNPWGHPPARRSSSCRAAGPARRAAAVPKRHRAPPTAPAVIRTWGRGDVVGGMGTRRGAVCGAGQGGTWRGADRCPPRGTAAAAQGGRLRAEGERGAAMPVGTPWGEGWGHRGDTEGVGKFPPTAPPIAARGVRFPPITARQTPASHQSWREGQGSYQSQQRRRKVPPIAAEHASASIQSRQNTPPSHQSQQTGHSSHPSLGEGGTDATNHSTAHLPPTNHSSGAGASHQSQRSTPASHQRHGDRATSGHQ